MTKFVWFWLADGRGQVPVNPDQVAYALPQRVPPDHTKLVFGAVTGGLHELVVQGDCRAVVAALEAARAAASPAPQAAPPAASQAAPRRRRGPSPQPA